MAAEDLLFRRPRLGQVRTKLGPQSEPLPVLESAASSLPSSPESRRDSPALDAAISAMLPGGTLQDPSSDSLTLVGRESDELDASIPPLQLQDPMAVPSVATLSRRTSTASLAPVALKSPGTSAMEGAMKSISNLSRRSSNSLKRVHNLVASRRPSSTHPRSRDGSVGPGLVRRRGSTSNPNLPLDPNSPFLTDSDDEFALDRDDCGSVFSADGVYSTPASVTSSANPLSAITGPVIPEPMLKGTVMTKVGKKRNTKRITLAYDPVAVKVYWDKDRSSNKVIYIDDIREIRTAEDIGQYRLDSGLHESMGPRFFSILYTRQGQASMRTLHVLTEDEATLKTWTDTLEDICRRRQAFATSLMAFDDKALRRWWQNESAKLLADDRMRPLGEGKPEFLGIEHVCRSLHIHLPAQELRERIEAVKGKKASYDRLEFAEFLEFVQLLKTRRDIRSIYNQIAENPERGLTKSEFFRFLRDVQRENVEAELASWENTFAYFARKGKLRDAEKLLSGAEETLTISEAGLTSFLTSATNSAIPKEPHYYKLDRPMSEYYISSSHNTYLLGWQVAGVSSVEGYISTLLRGCRCVEIDCWDGANDEPLVTHGHTRTSKVSFREVVKTINRYAFVKSPFPLWISLEVRCSLATQANMAKIMIEIFGEKLVREPLVKNPDRLPTPSDLMERILIKVKQSQPAEEPARSGERLMRRRGNSQPSPYQRPAPLDSTPLPSSPLLSPTSFSRSSRQVNTPNTITEGRVHDTSSGSPSECESESEKDSTNRKFSSKINPVLGELGVYCVGIPFEGFESPEAKKYNHIFSFKEKTFAEKSQPRELKQQLKIHNMRYMMRVYPNGNRIRSSNFDPLPYWKRGVQMAALNWQTFDTGMQLNQAMFEGGTDQSGYVLKPVEAREFQLRPEISPEECVDKRPRKKATLTISVISAQQLMRPFNLGEKRSMDPYIEVEILLADDKRNKTDAAAIGLTPESHKRRTRIARENGFNPQFNDTFEFDITTKYPDLIFVRFNVKLADKSYSDRALLLGTFTAKLGSLNQGYRTIPLHNQYGERYIFSTLFCHIKKEKFADVMVDYAEGTPKNGGKLNRLGKAVFPSSSQSPKTSIESSRSS
ncbi:hypothetical protein QBC47DRAFT_297983 [Echria macrotheca]|uniref:Phosphoinositide phospholipase C n=1 Tax=Echria macrotheca TaxID=438768 RepID=A0AAJ0BGU8_9PEZI|nr:hypothetical protein QBC47DRAFT_297983 [Echria macrotheca]